MKWILQNNGKIKTALFVSLVFALLYCGIFSSCNVADKEIPVYTDTTVVNEKDRAAIIESYRLGINDIAFTDSSKLQVTSTTAKKLAYDLSDFLSDLNGHLKSLAMDKKIMLGQLKPVIDTAQYNNTTNRDALFTQTAINLLKNKISLFTRYAGETTDADTKNYFDTALPVLQKQLAAMTQKAR